MKSKRNLSKAIAIILVIFALYCAVVFAIMRFHHPDYTETELFLSFIKAFILDFS